MKIVMKDLYTALTVSKVLPTKEILRIASAVNGASVATLEQVLLASKGFEVFPYALKCLSPEEQAMTRDRLSDGMMQWVEDVFRHTAKAMQVSSDGVPEVADTGYQKEWIRENDKMLTFIRLNHEHHTISMHNALTLVHRRMQHAVAVFVAHQGCPAEEVPKVAATFYNAAAKQLCRALAV